MFTLRLVPNGQPYVVMGYDTEMYWLSTRDIEYVHFSWFNKIKGYAEDNIWCINMHQPNTPK